MSYELLLLVIFEENISNICWSQLLTYEDLMLFYGFGENFTVFLHIVEERIVAN